MSNESLQTVSQIVVALGILLTALGGLGAYHFGQRVAAEERDAAQRRQELAAAQSAVVGQLKGPKITLMSGQDRIYPAIEFGDSGSMLVFTGPNGAPMIEIGDDNELTIESEAGQLLVSITIRDRSGTIVAQLVRNEWKVNPAATFDRNYSADALEVKDSTGDVVLQVRLVEQRIQFQAKLYDRTGRGISFGKLRGPDGWGGGIEMTGPAYPELLLKIQPMFKYPSHLHLHQLERPIG